MSKYFKEKFEADKLGDAPNVLVGLFDDAIIKASCKEVHEEIAERLYFIGSAYKLHYCSLVDIYGDLKLTDLQCKNFLEELNFVDSFVNDPLLKSAIADIKSVLSECIKQNGKTKFIMSGN